MMGKDHLWYGLSAGGACALLALTGHVHAVVQVGSHELTLGQPGPVDALWFVAASAVRQSSA